ncbi:toll/interleukin-1 receptor domain-containing protein [Chryseobacterium profundimaris]|uniref:TIR domain-containing protein n=1 Tax=Chryseobacterium profundimaris TaxID=1387275 RepID=A0ABY1P471_9FLAO|nr:toll/interleukin-1 receptor domain-containing protein [Chryseobacterium profundimaris]SMP24484.1 TIR domain-containing protein [Chryseobacterium profundimaris]
MNRAFLSHSSKQKDLIKKIANNLGKASCVFDEFEFEAGMPIFEEIKKGIGQSDIFVLFISDDALNSFWVKQEIIEIKNLIDDGLDKQFFPILIDKSLNISADIRIPNWLKKYLLNPLTEHFLITKKIQQRLRDVALDKNPLFKAKAKLFIGRQDQFDLFESKIYNVLGTKPKSIIVSGLEGIGRRTFLKKAFVRDERIKDFYDPIYITLDTKDSIEDFILKLQDYKGDNSNDYLEQLSQIEYFEKVNEAKQLLIRIKNNNEFVFIIDSGCIIKPTKQIADWYLEIINDPEFENLFTINIISRFRPSNDIIRNNKNILHFNITNLSDNDTEKLFVKYYSLLNIDLKKEQAEEILTLLNGIPSQVHYAVERIKDFGIIDTLKRKDEIIDYGETQVFYIVDNIRNKGKFAYDLLVLISSFDFISYDFIYSIVGKNDDVETLLENFYITGVFDLVGANKEYIKVHYPIADYLTRSKAKIDPDYKKKLKNKIQKFIKNEDQILDFQDISQLLHNIKGAIISGYTLPDKYYIPSFVLKTIVELYYIENYNSVISLIDKVLESARRIDQDLVREFKYWLCLSLARQKNARFEIEVQEIEGADYNYLYGFYFRIKKQLDNSENYLRGALSKNSSFQRAKRELVNVLLLKSKFNEAIEMAKSNYENQKLNAFHIQAYFLCLTRKKHLSREDKIIIEELLKNIERSYDFRAKEIAIVMKGEYLFYVKNDLSNAIITLKECLDKNKRKHYPRKALFDIYNKLEMYSAANEVNVKNIEIEESLTLSHEVCKLKS